jgi:hemerythrin
MIRLNWYKRYSVNNKELDNHHKKLFSIFNRLYDACMEKNDAASLKLLIDELVYYSDYHFKAEEQYMRDCDYKEIDRHISEHKYFTEWVIDFKKNYIVADLKICLDVIRFLGDWLRNHVIEEDKKIVLKSQKEETSHVIST